MSPSRTTRKSKSAVAPVEQANTNPIQTTSAVKENATMSEFEKRCAAHNISATKIEYTVEEAHLITGYAPMNITSRCRGINSASKKPYPSDRRIQCHMITNDSNRSQWLIAAASVADMIVWYDAHVDGKVARRDHPEAFGKPKTAAPATLESVLAKEVKAGTRTQESMNELLALANKR